MPSEVITDEERLTRAVGSLRNMLRDKKSLNKLLAGQEESSDEELRQCMIEALIDWNESPPRIGPVTLRNHPNKLLLLQGAAIQAITSSALWHAREHMPSSDGGTSGDDHDKMSSYAGILDRLSQDYERKKTDKKAAINIEQALNGMSVSSEYALGAYGNLSIYGFDW